MAGLFHRFMLRVVLKNRCWSCYAPYTQAPNNPSVRYCTTEGCEEFGNGDQDDEPRTDLERDD